MCQNERYWGHRLDHFTMLASLLTVRFGLSYQIIAPVRGPDTAEAVEIAVIGKEVESEDTLVSVNEFRAIPLESAVTHKYNRLAFDRIADEFLEIHLSVTPS